MLRKPESRCTIHIQIVLDQIWATVESPSVAKRMEKEVLEFGEIKYKQGGSYVWLSQHSGRLICETHSHYTFIIRPTFNIREIAIWLCRGESVIFDTD